MFGLKLGYLLFEATEQLSRALQGKDMTLQEAITTANQAKNHYTRLCTQGDFNKFYQSCVSFSEGRTSANQCCSDTGEPQQGLMTELLLIGLNVLRITIGCNTMKPVAKLKHNEKADSTKSS